jgi:hypothetical protein
MFSSLVHLMPISVPFFNKISWLCEQQLRGDEASNGGSTRPQQGMTLRRTLIFPFYFLPWELDPSQNVSTGSVLRLDARCEPGWFSLKATLKITLKTDAGFQFASELNTGCTSPDEGENLPHFAGKKTLVSRGGRFSHRVGATQLVQTLTSDRAGCRLLWHLASPPQPPPDRIYSFWAIFCISQPGKQGFCTVQEVPKR